MSCEKENNLNKGDALQVILDYTVNDISLADAELDEIELYIGNNRFLLSDGSIILDAEINKYVVFLTQEMSFTLTEFFKTQLRVRKGNEVSSASIQINMIGDVISKEVI